MKAMEAVAAAAEATEAAAEATQAVEEKEVTTGEQESNNKDTRIKDETDSGSGAWGAPHF